MMSHESEPSLLGKSILQSTFSDGHCFLPDFDISVIKGKVTENAVEPERNPENDKRLIEMQTFLLAYLTAKVSQSSIISDIRLSKYFFDHSTANRSIIIFPTIQPKISFMFDLRWRAILRSSRLKQR